jgi:DNA repair protein RecO (recombination protein O)
VTQDLRYVSPKTGRAVSGAAAGEWADRLLPLPPVMRGEGAAEDIEILTALRTTGFFLESKLAPALGNRPIPEARGRFLDALARRV